MAVKVRQWKGQKGVYGVFIDHRGQRTKKKVGSKEAAENVRRAIEAELSRGDFKVPQRGLTWKALADEWLTTYPLTREVSDTTMQNYRSSITNHLTPYFGAMPVADIDFQRIEGFIAEKLSPNGSARYPGRALAKSALRIVLVSLRLVLDRAVKVHRVLPVNPAHGVSRLGRPDDSVGVDPFTPKELRAILKAADALDPMLATWIRLWVQSGMRLGEVSALRVQDADLVTGKALVRRTFSNGRLGPTKTRQTRLVSFLHPLTEDTSEWRPGITDESRRVLADLRRLPSWTPDQPDRFCFGGDEPPAAWRFNRWWRAILTEANVRYRSPEMLRHTWASNLLSRNAPLVYVTKLGGWRSAAVLLKVYSRWIEEALPAPPDLPMLDVASASGTIDATDHERIEARPAAPQAHPRAARVTLTGR